MVPRACTRDFLEPDESHRSRHLMARLGGCYTRHCTERLANTLATIGGGDMGRRAGGSEPCFGRRGVHRGDRSVRKSFIGPRRTLTILEPASNTSLKRSLSTSHSSSSARTGPVCSSSLHLHTLSMHASPPQTPRVPPALATQTPRIEPTAYSGIMTTSSSGLRKNSEPGARQWERRGVTPLRQVA